ncbi:hypothetical protein D3C81_456940 [compost metagenome]
MAQGLQVFDTAGNTVLDTTARLGIVLGYVDTGTVDGSLAVPDFIRGTPFFFMTPLEAMAPSQLVPGVSVSGTSLVWAFIGGASNSLKISVRIYYGIY